MEEKQISNLESLKIIQQMINVAKEDRFEDGDGWLIWGWLLFVASVSSVVMYYTNYTRYVGLVWLCMLGVGLIVYAIAKFNSKKKHRVNTYVHELVHKIEIGFFISLLTIVAGSMLYGHLYLFGYYYILYAFWMFIHGSAIRFRPLIIGAFVNWAAAVAIFVVAKDGNLGYVMIISAIAILVGYLVPGYMLRSEFKSKIKSEQRGNGI